MLSEALLRITQLDPTLNEHSALSNKGWLNVEGHYRAAGWYVEYYKPDYTENWKSYYLFKKKGAFERIFGQKLRFA